MPELPDVEMMRRSIESTSLGHRIVAIRADDTRLLKVSVSGLQQTLLGSVFNYCLRHGKFVFLGTDKGLALVLHFGMSGNVRYLKSADHEPEHTHMVINFENKHYLAYISVRKLGRIDLTQNVDSFVDTNNLGPDAFDVGLDAADFKARVGRGRGTIKAALMDQSKIAGLGNIYSDEILFRAHVHPKTHVNDLDDAALQKLFRETRHVMRIATQRDANPKHFPKSWIIKHRSEGSACPACGGMIARTKVSGRTSYFCPACQKPNRLTQQAL